jgi:spermidine/putrescine transport system ATP-binding protein
MFDLECKNLTKRFGAFTAVANVSLSIPNGSFFSILGPSGCGKTTLMRMIAVFETPTQGDILIKGRSVLGRPPNKRNVKMVFQHLALFPMMNVGENIAYGLRCRGENKSDIARKVASVLERMGLPGAQEKRISQLSGGQKQRIAIARCMVLEPDVLLLDEPLGALDLKLREHMKIELKQLQSQFGTTFLYITHDQSEALVMSDNVAVMNGGRVEQIGAPEALYRNPSSAFVAGFVGDSNRWRGEVLDVADGVARVRCADGNIVRSALGDPTAKAGAEVEVFVRPESLVLKRGDAAAREGENVVTGTVASLLFNGAASRVLVATPATGLVEAACGLETWDARPDIGAPAALTWRPENSVCFAAKG